MPFKSERQKRYLFANEPALAQKWASKYGSKPKPKAKSANAKKRKKRK